MVLKDSIKMDNAFVKENFLMMGNKKIVMIVSIHAPLA
jgi:hypothetical protein